MSLQKIERIRNTEIRRKMHAERTIMDEIEHRRLKCYRHLRRMKDGRIPKVVHGKLKEETEEEDRELRGTVNEEIWSNGSRHRGQRAMEMFN